MKFVKIKNIKNIPTEPIYHLSVENNHNFFANKLCVHNCGYRGEIRVRFKTTKKGFTMSSTGVWTDYPVYENVYEIGDRVAQLIIMPFPTIEVIETNELNETQRGEQGFGSTGN